MSDEMKHSSPRQSKLAGMSKRLSIIWTIQPPASGCASTLVITRHQKRTPTFFKKWIATHRPNEKMSFEIVWNLRGRRQSTLWKL